MDKQLLMSGQGGGAWGCFPAGALYEYYQQGGTVYDGGFGVSVSALHVAKIFSSDDGKIPNAAKQQKNSEELKDFWFNLKGNDDIYKPWPKKKLGTLLAWPVLSALRIDKKLKDAIVAILEGKNSAYDNAPLEKLLRAALDGRKWHESVRVGVVEYPTASFIEVSLGGNANWADAVLASTAIPMAYPPKILKWDGGVMHMTPLEGAFHRLSELRKEKPGAEQELHVYRTSPFPSHTNSGKSYGALPDVAWRTIQIMNANSDQEDLDNARFFNDLSNIVSLARQSTDQSLRAEIEKRYSRYGKVKVYVISQSEEDAEKFMPKDGYSFDPDGIRKGFELGRRVMQDFLANKEKYNVENLL